MIDNKKFFEPNTQQTFKFLFTVMISVLEWIRVLEGRRWRLGHF